MNEHILQRNLTIAGLASFLAFPLLGPIGLCAPVAIFAGKFLRPVYNKKASETYESEEKQIKSEIKQEREAFLQRQEQERENLRNHERELYSQAQSKADEYLSRLPPEEYSKVKGVRLYLPGQRRTFLGIPFGRRHTLEYEIVR